MQKDRGFIKLILLLIIFILLLSYFGFDLRGIAESPQAKSNFSYVWNFIAYVWNTFLLGPVTWLWNFLINLFKASGGL